MSALSSKESMNALIHEAIPSSMKVLSDKSQHISDVVQYLEGSYITASSDTTSGMSRAAVENQAKAYVMDILSNIATDIAGLAENMDSVLKLQGEAIDSLTNQVEVAHSRMKMDKENCGKAMLDEYRAVVVSGPETSNISWGVRKAVNTTSLANGGNMDASVRAPAPTAALTMQQRMASLDEVGVCLSKSTAIEQSRPMNSRASTKHRQSTVYTGTGMDSNGDVPKKRVSIVPIVPPAPPHFGQR